MNSEYLFNRLKESYRAGVNHTPENRIEALRSLRKMVTEQEGPLCEAISRDFGKPYFEAFTSEIFTVVHEIDYHLKQLRKWFTPKRVSDSITTFPSKSTVTFRPLGTVLIIGAWNYPVHLTLMPLIGALSAGNTVLLKPSEIASETSSLLASLFERYMDPKVVSVAEGGAELTTELLTLPFDHIFFTGSTRVGKIVMKAAAEQLIPVTLELGGKSPAIVHKDADIAVSARRIWWGKTMNAGQICVAPDFAAVHESVYEAFIEESKKVLSQFFREDYRVKVNYTQIINETHFDRLSNLLDSSIIKFGGSVNRDTRFIEPALIDAKWDDLIMEEEIFGPLLPVITYRTPDELTKHLLKMSAPLALYLFTESESLIKQITETIPFGGGCVNDTISHLTNPSLPFGGIGDSGMGSYHGRASFETFSRKQSLLKKGFWPDPGLRYPPYSNSLIKWLKTWIQ